MENRTKQKMETLQYIQQAFALIGFGTNHSLWNIYHLIGFAIAGLAIPSFFLFTIYVADTIKEFTDSIFMTAVAIAIFISFINTIHKRSKLILLFNLFEENIAKSEPLNFYSHSKHVASEIKYIFFMKNLF